MIANPNSPPENHFLSEATQIDLARLESRLNDHLLPLLPQTDRLSLLNVACGRADETGVWSRLLEQKAGAVRLNGLDIRAAEISSAAENWRDLGEKTEVGFSVHRGDRIKDLRELETPDVAFLRHQNFWDAPGTWTRIFDQTLEKLNENGLLVITSYFDREHALALHALERLGAVRVTSERAQNSRLLKNVSGKSVDRHLAIFRKS